MERCETCTYWDRPEVEGEPGQCQRIEPLTLGKTDRAARKVAVAFIPADFDMPWMQTRAEFGCALHEEKE